MYILKSLIQLLSLPCILVDTWESERDNPIEICGSFKLILAFYLASSLLPMLPPWAARPSSTLDSLRTQ